MEKEPIFKKEQARDALLISLAGGVIFIIAAITERALFLEQNIDVYAAINMGGATIAGAAMAVGGAIKHLDLRRASNRGE